MKVNLYIMFDLQEDFIKELNISEEYLNNLSNFLKNAKEKAETNIFLAINSEHNSNYLETFEGKSVGKPLAIRNTEGAKLNKQIIEACDPWKFPKKYFVLSAEDWKNYLEGLDIENTYLFGLNLETSILQNAFSLREAYPNLNITLLKDYCAENSEEVYKLLTKNYFNIQ